MLILCNIFLYFYIIFCTFSGIYHVWRHFSFWKSINYDSYPEVNVNAVWRLYGESSVFRSRFVNLECDLWGWPLSEFWYELMGLESKLDSIGCFERGSLSIPVLVWTSSQMCRGVVEMCPVPMEPNCFWNTLTILGWQCPTKNRDKSTHKIQIHI